MSAVTEVAARLALPARWLVVAGIAYTLATSVLYVLSPPVTHPQFYRMYMIFSVAWDAWA